MNNSAFLSDSLKSNLEHKIEIKQSFISDNEIPNLDTKKFKSEKIEKYNIKNDNNKYVMKSATTRKWSIKFK